MSSRGSGIERRRVQASLRRTFDLFEAAIQVPGLQSDSLWKPVGLQMCVGWPPRNSSFFEGVIDLIACLVSSGGQSNDAATRAEPARWVQSSTRRDLQIRDGRADQKRSEKGSEARERWPKKTKVPSGRPVGLSVNQTVLRLAQEFFLAFPCATLSDPSCIPSSPYCSPAVSWPLTRAPWWDQASNVITLRKTCRTEGRPVVYVRGPEVTTVPPGAGYHQRPVPFVRWVDFLVRSI